MRSASLAGAQVVGSETDVRALELAVALFWLTIADPDIRDLTGCLARYAVPDHHVRRAARVWSTAGYGTPEEALRLLQELRALLRHGAAHRVDLLLQRRLALLEPSAEGSPSAGERLRGPCCCFKIFNSLIQCLDFTLLVDAASRIRK